MKITFRECRFLLFFLPIFFLKLLNITASNKILVLVSIVCFATIVINFIQEKITRTKFVWMMLLVFYTAFLVINCGKQGAFFSVVTILALDKVDPQKVIYKWMFLSGILGVLLLCLMERNGKMTIRYIGGTWTEIIKRSNILYISFAAVICIYLYLQRENKLQIYKILIITILGYMMYKYVGSRTGFLSLIVLLVLLMGFRYKLFYKNKFIKWGCILSPLIGMIISLFSSYQYGDLPILYTVNNMLQGRLAQGKAFLQKYNLKIFGQIIYESTELADYAVLDCAYLDMLICYGVLFALLWLIISCLVIKYLYDRERYIEVATIVMYAVYGISETFLPNCYLNVSVILYAEYIYYVIGKVEKKNIVLI